MKLHQRQPHCIAGHVDEGNAAAGAQETGAPVLHPHHLSGRSSGSGRAMATMRATRDANAYLTSKCAIRLGCGQHGLPDRDQLGNRLITFERPSSSFLRGRMGAWLVQHAL